MNLFSYGWNGPLDLNWSDFDFESESLRAIGSSHFITASRLTFNAKGFVHITDFSDGILQFSNLKYRLMLNA